MLQEEEGLVEGLRCVQVLVETSSVPYFFSDEWQWHEDRASWLAVAHAPSCVQETAIQSDVLWSFPFRLHLVVEGTKGSQEALVTADEEEPWSF